MKKPIRKPRSEDEDDELPNKNKLPPSDETFDNDLLDKLHAQLDIDPHALDEALLQQPNNLFAVSEALSLWVSRRDAQKKYLAEAESRAERAIRHNAEKITVKEVEAGVQLDKDVRAAQDDLIRFNHTAARFSNLKEAYQQRGYALKELVSLYLANYYASNSEQGRGASMIKDRAARDARDVVHQERMRNK